MKKLIQVSLMVVLVFILLQAMIGNTFVPADKMVSHENLQYTTATMSGQSVQVLICSSGRLVNCVLPNVGWNS